MARQTGGSRRLATTSPPTRNHPHTRKLTALDLTGNGDERTGELTDTAETTNGVGETSDVDEATQAA